MFLQFLIAFFSLSLLAFFHEFGHFIFAKKFGVKVEEFGIGLPPRLFAKKIKDTVYSINLLPFGGFVRLYGEEKERKDPQSFSQKSVGKRVLIVLGGALSFWIISWLIFTILLAKGIPREISDVENVPDAEIRIIFVMPDSPAEKVNLRSGDVIKKFGIENFEVSVTKIGEFQKLINDHKGKEVLLTIGRGDKIFEKKIVPRIQVPEGEGPLGVILTRVRTISYPWYLAPFKGLETLLMVSRNIILGTISILRNLALGKRVIGVELAGPLRIGHLLAQISEAGMNYYLSFLATISTYLAIFNLLPIPALDGGKLLFLTIEKIRRKPVSPKVEQKITAFFFILLLTLMILVTGKDIMYLLKRN